jgi:putative chitinase
MDDALKALLLAGLMGMVGQGARAIVGLKSMTDQAAAQGLDQNDLFRAARLLVSLMIGFVSGVAAAFLLGIDKVVAVTAANNQVLLGLAAAGYAGTDAIEGFISRYLPGQGPGQAPLQTRPPAPERTPRATSARDSTRFPLSWRPTKATLRRRRNKMRLS